MVDHVSIDSFSRVSFVAADGQIVRLSNTAPRIPSEPVRILDGPELWQRLHTKRNATREWFENDWVPLLQHLGCECGRGFQKIRETWAPDFTNDDAFFVSTIHLHNAVNQKLIDAGDTRKRIVSIEDARTLWNRPAP